MVHDASFILEAERRGERQTEGFNRNVQGTVRGNHRQSAVRSQGLDFDYVIEKTIQLIGYISVQELELLTPHEWEQMIKGARHRRLDGLEDMRTQSIMFAQLNNGKNVKAISKKLDEERALINQTKSSYEFDKVQKRKHERAKRIVRQRALQRWLDNKNSK